MLVSGPTPRRSVMTSGRELRRDTLGCRNRDKKKSRPRVVPAAFRRIAGEYDVRFVCAPSIRIEDVDRQFAGAGQSVPDEKTPDLWHQAMTIQRVLFKGLGVFQRY